MVLAPLVAAAAQYAVLSRCGVAGEARAARVARTVRAGGVVSQKVAQIAAARPDLVTDPDLLRELRQLQSRRVAPDVHEASIATVRIDRARGLAVKTVKGPDVLADGAALTRWLRVLRPVRRAVPKVAAVVDMLETLEGELDFESELAKNRLFRGSLRGSRAVAVPETLESTRERVVMRFVPSVLAKDLGAAVVPLRLVRDFFMDVTLAAVRTGVVHLDLHSGNVGYCAASGRVVVYDMGSVRVVDVAACRRAFVSMFRASELMFFEDWDGLARFLVSRGLVTEVRDTRNLRLLTAVAWDYAHGAAGTADIGRCLRQIRGDVVMDASIFQLIQSLSILEGVCKVLNPAFTMASSLGRLPLLELVSIMEA